MPYRILLVDDSPLIRKLLRSWIQQQPEWVVCGEAENGREGVDKVLELHPDVVLLDLQMPVMDGMEAARQIGLLAPQVGMKIGIVMCTMHASPQLSHDAKAVGISEVVCKSETRPDSLLAALRRACA